MLNFERRPGTITLKGFNWSCSEARTPPSLEAQASSDLHFEIAQVPASVVFPFEQGLAACVPAVPSLHGLLPCGMCVCTPRWLCTCLYTAGLQMPSRTKAFCFILLEAS